MKSLPHDWPISYSCCKYLNISPNKVASECTDLCSLWNNLRLHAIHENFVQVCLQVKGENVGDCTATLLGNVET